MKTFIRSKSVKFGLAAGVIGALTGFALPASADSSIDFDIENGQVAPSESFATKVTLLGAAIQTGGQDRPVTMRLIIGGKTIEPFGSFDNPADGNVNTGIGRTAIPWMTFASDTNIQVEAQSWVLGGSVVHRKANSYDDSPYVKVLRDGDTVPALKGYQDQGDLVSFVTDYIDTDSNTIVLGKNEVIFLFELGVANLTTSGADFQDLVIVIELGDSPEDLSGASSDTDVMFD